MHANKHYLQGDGFCDDHTNTADCEWDGGDCCDPDVLTAHCTACLCLDPDYGNEEISACHEFYLPYLVSIFYKPQKYVYANKGPIHLLNTCKFCVNTCK